MLSSIKTVLPLISFSVAWRSATPAPCPSSGPRSTIGRLPRIAALIALLAIPGKSPALEPVVLPLGGDFQAIIDAHPPGTRYLVSPGVHRGVQMVPKDGDVISGQPGAILNGSLVLENWSSEGEWWVHEAPVVTPISTPGGVECAEPMCAQPQNFFLDGARLKPVQSLEWLLSDDQWFLDRENAKVYLRFDPRTRLAEFGGPSRTAIECAPVDRPRPAGVIIEDLAIEKYPCPPQVGMVRLGEGCVIRRCILRHSHSYGVQLMGHASVIQDCYIAHNGMCGIGGTGIGAIIEGCEIAHNVSSAFAGLAWDNGGVKVASTRDTVLRRNYIHHNRGPGLWWDIKTTLMTVEDNIVEFNQWEGILMEISDQAIIRRNICRWNGVLHRTALWGAQICVQNGSGAHIYENYLETGADFNSPYGSRQGVMVINQVDRAWDEAHFQGNFGVRKIHVHDNTMVMPQGGHNGVDYGTLGWATYDDFLAADIEWHHNRYFAGRPLDHRWSWRLLPNWNTTVGQWLLWENWSGLQDEGSVFQPVGPYEFPPTGTAQLPLIKETTGHDYALLKAELIRRPAAANTDDDDDGLTDWWELLHFPGLGSTDGTSDTDADGLNDAAEFAAGTHPLKPDSDADRLPDGWERAHGLDPLTFDSHLDPDQDGRPHYEEFEDGTDPFVAESNDLPAPENAVSLWFASSSRLTTVEDGRLTRWSSVNPTGINMGWFGTPHVAATSATGLPLIDPGDMLLVGGAEDRWGTLESGFTFSFIYRPGELDLNREWRAVLTNEVYLNQGFRLRLEGGILIFHAGQSGGSLSLAGHTRLTEGKNHLISIAVGPGGTGGSLYLDGRLEAHSLTGLVRPSPGLLMLGNINGVTPQDAAFGDIAVFRRLLSHRERRSVESLLMQKFNTGLPDAADRDRDGLPDAWEAAANLDPLTPNGSVDEDNDGASNLAEFQLGLDPLRADTDNDGLPDGWEITWGTDPLVADGAADPDEDGLSNLEEYQNHTDPMVPDVVPPFLVFNRMRLWWRADHGLNLGQPAYAQWIDSSAGGRHGRPQAAEPVPQLGSEQWNNHSVLRLPENPLVSILPVDPSTLLHPRGATLSVVLRPISGAPTTEGQSILSYGNFRLGVTEGKLVIANQDGSLSAVAADPLPAQPFVLTCLLGTDAAPARVFVNGDLSLELRGLGDASAAEFRLGGPSPWPCDVAEVILHAGTLPPLDRRFLDLLLEAKWLGTGRLADDSDDDGLPDWWEYQACTDPYLADADQDVDWDGTSNLQAFAAGRPGFVWADSDEDGMHDAWESLHALDPAINDAHLDPDHDGLPHGLEFALLTNPELFDGSDSWLLHLASNETSAALSLHLRFSRRSWAHRARWQVNQSLETNGWSWLQPGRIIDHLPGAISTEDTLLSQDALNGPPRALLRVSLIPE